MTRKFFTILIFASLTNLYSQNKIAVTIDDLPLSRIGNYEKNYYESVTDKLLDNIKKQKAPVIGFVNESKLYTNGTLDESKVELLRKWIDAGIELGNHTFSHRSANSIPTGEFLQDIIKGEEITKKLLEENGKEIRYFRHPFLHTGLSIETKSEIEKFLTAHGYTIAPVTIDNAEWIFAAAYDKANVKSDTLLMKKIGSDYVGYMKDKLEYWERQSNALFGRNIAHTLLIHANPLNSDFYDELCNMLKEKKYEFITLDEALKDEAYKSEDRFIKNNGISWLHRWAFTEGRKKDFFGDEPQVPKHIMEIAGIEHE